MHGSHSTLLRTLTTAMILSGTTSQLPADDIDSKQLDGTEVPLSVRVTPDRVTTFTASVSVDGSLTTPATTGVRQFDLTSSVQFEFDQRQFESELSGPLALQAVRRYTIARAESLVGKSHRTKSQLPAQHTVIQIRGDDSNMIVAPVSGLLTRQQHDLLQMPCDPLPCAGLLPTRQVEPGEKWNTNNWVLPRLTGLDAVTEQSITCELISVNTSSAQISFTGKANGAASGSATSLELTGRLTIDRQQELIRSLTCTLNEKRSPGPVSPGIDAEIKVEWSQQPAKESKLPEQFLPDIFDRGFLLATPWRIQLKHSAEWHVFNQTERVMMLRQMRDGALISQCNISSGVVMPPGQHTSDADFRSDIERQAAAAAAAGQIVGENTLRDDNHWRIRHVRTASQASDVEIIRDYYLCSAASGEQYSLVFSYSKADDKAFGSEAQEWLSSLSLARRRPALPFR